MLPHHRGNSAKRPPPSMRSFRTKLSQELQRLFPESRCLSSFINIAGIILVCITIHSSCARLNRGFLQ
ncbi:hypothetical protein BDZ85DRAFT_37714 [Elsinoe ampelina]|uniref:Uncharacterized protein n=1 Tax=Elsinoe ampelina TaxID=302913 RepID=A0A6A6G2W5_9PEZI|nr:hypothetical protein BDZ85DRAFT_37714 [Elsinoe ampelina]